MLTQRLPEQAPAGSLIAWRLGTQTDQVWDALLVFSQVRERPFTVCGTRGAWIIEDHPHPVGEPLERAKIPVVLGGVGVSRPIPIAVRQQPVAQDPHGTQRQRQPAPPARITRRGRVPDQHHAVAIGVFDPSVGSLEASQRPSHLRALIPSGRYSGRDTHRHELGERSPAAQMDGLALPVNARISPEPSLAHRSHQGERPAWRIDAELSLILRRLRSLEQYAGHDHVLRITAYGEATPLAAGGVAAVGGGNEAGLIDGVATIVPSLYRHRPARLK